jgi:ribonuclease HI
LVHNSNIIHTGVSFIGKATNNTAEYTAIINALKITHKFSRWRIQVYSDSNLAIQQINKKWRINKPHLSKLCEEVNKLRKKYEIVEFFHINRTNKFIQKCDELCNNRLDAEGFS